MSTERPIISLLLGHDLKLQVVPVKGKADHPTPYADGPPVIGYVLQAVTVKDESHLSMLGECGRQGPSDGMLRIAAEQALRFFPEHGQVKPTSAATQTHTFVRDRSKSGFECKTCKGEFPANHAIHNR